ncbi:MAG: DUF5132 domain-containing protein [Thioalkalispiraceae bacterium]
MALEDAFKNGTGKGLAIGIGLAILTPVLLPVLARAAKPTARAALKSGMILYEKGQEAIAEFGEVVEDLLAEARAEHEQETGVTTDDSTQATSSETAAQATEKVNES